MKKTIFAMIMAGLMLVTVFSACFTASAASRTSDMNIIDISPVSKDESGGDEAQWTFIAYLDGDNNLDDPWNSIVSSLESMEMVGSTQDVQVVAQIDRSEVSTSWKTTRRYHVTYDPDEGIGSELIADLGELNMGDPETLSDFVCWAIDTYPAEHYYLVLFDHGFGWPGICIDETNGNDWLTMDDLKEALRDVKIHLGRNLDVLWFYACVMGTIEVYYSIKDYVDLGISSEDIGYAECRIYQEILEDLSLNPGWIPTKVAEVTAEYCYNLGLFDKVAVIDTSKIDNLVEKMDILGEILYDTLPAYGQRILEAALEAPSFLVCGPWGGLDGQIDLYEFASNLKEKFAFNSNKNPLIKWEIRNAAGNVMQAIDDAVVFSIQDPPGWEGSAHGFSVLSLHDDETRYVLEEYCKTDFAEDTSWDEFLDKFLDQPPNKPSKPSGPTSGKAGTEYTYSTSTSDPNGDQVKYGWDWDGDLVVDEWTDFYASGKTVETTHTWNEQRTYEIRVKAKDTHGAESDWSDPLAVSMPKNKDSNNKDGSTRQSVISRLVDGFRGSTPEPGNQQPVLPSLFTRMRQSIFERSPSNTQTPASTPTFPIIRELLLRLR